MSLFNPECKGKLLENEIKSVIFFNLSDYVWDENGVMIRIKRKYGKFKREAFKYKL